jgi:hypothetical protein
LSSAESAGRIFVAYSRDLELARRTKSVGECVSFIAFDDGDAQRFGLSRTKGDSEYECDEEWKSKRPKECFGLTKKNAPPHEEQLNEWTLHE